MPVMSTQTRAGDPTVQVTGQARGTVKYIFDDGFAIELAIRTSTLAEFDPEITARIPEVELSRRKMDSNAVVEDDIADTGNGAASTLDTMVVKLRYAYSQPLPEDSYRNMNQIDNYRINKGWTWTQVHNAIFNVPEYEFTEEEWSNIMDRFSYLDFPAKIQIMIDYDNLRSGDIWGRS